MGYDLKYGKVTTEYSDIPDDEPVIIFRAQDIWTPTVIAHYFGLVHSSGKFTNAQLELLQTAMNEVMDWTSSHPKSVKNPD